MEKILVQIFNPTLHGEGGIKNEAIEKLVTERTLQNMIFVTHKNKDCFLDITCRISDSLVNQVFVWPTLFEYVMYDIG